MIIPKSIEVKNSAGEGAAFLSPRADGLKECYINTKLNGESQLEFMLPANCEKINELTPDCTIWAGGKVFTLLKDDATDFVRDENNRLWAKFMAAERWSELDTQFPEPYITNDPTTPEPADLAVIIVGGGSDLSGGRYPVGSAGHALYAVLDGSGWSVGTVDVEGIHDLETEKESRLALVKAIQEKWGGYLVWDSVNKVVNLRDGGEWQTYRGFQIRYAKNLQHITRTQSNRIVTKLYAFGHDDLDIASVNDGKKYVTNYSYTNREYVSIYKNQDIYDPEELLEKATAELELICRPRYNYTVKIADLRTLPEYSHEEFALGDMADIVDPSVAPDKPRVRLIRHRYNVFQPWKCEIELGDPNETLWEQFKASFDTSGFVDGKFNGSGKYSGYSIEDLTIGDAKIKNLEANKITTEKAKITTAQIEELIVGGNVTMGPDATISWEKVENQPFIPDENYITTITHDTVTTSFVNALDVTAKNLKGGTLEVGTTNKTKIFNSNGSGIYALMDQDGNLVGQLTYNGSLVKLATSAGKQLQFDSDGSLYLLADSEIVLAGDDISLSPSSGNRAYYYGPSYSSNPEIATKGDIPDVPDIPDLSDYATESWVNRNFADDDHDHGDDYVHSRTGDDVSIAVTDAGIVVRLNGEVKGSLMFD